MPEEPTPTEPLTQPDAAASGSAEFGTAFKLSDTRIQTGGVMRCCLETVATEYEGKDGQPDRLVSIGHTSKCEYCTETFTLIAAKPFPKWMPDWQINQQNAEGMPHTKGSIQ